jgi:two-component system nitrogen regulation sensor histidine kinase GlnL
MPIFVPLVGHSQRVAHTISPGHSVGWISVVVLGPWRGKYRNAQFINYLMWLQKSLSVADLTVLFFIIMKELSFSTDKHLCIRSWGKEISEFTGKPRSEDVIGKKYYEILPRIYQGDQDALLLAARRKKALSFKGYSFTCLYAHIKADVKISPVKSADGRVARIKVFIRPSSTCSVAKKLDQSQRLIDIGKIASTLAHGVRNPLNAIKGAVVYLREKYVNEGTLIEFTRIMEEEISRLESFISRFLSSSVSATELSVTDINSLLKKIEVFTSLQIYTRNIRTTYELGDIPPILINSFHLEQAVLNVINNAIEAMDSGGQLTIRTLTEQRSETLFNVIEIADTGRGMDNANYDAVAAAKEQAGKGFGLFITREILKYYGGHVEINGRKNEGTTVRLYLPFKQPVQGQG